MPSFEKDLPSAQSNVSSDQLAEAVALLKVMADRLDDILAAIKGLGDRGNDVADGPDAKA